MSSDGRILLQAILRTGCEPDRVSARITVGEKVEVEVVAAKVIGVAALLLCTRMET
jgi:hypothetical protein